MDFDNFNPRSLAGATKKLCYNVDTVIFQSTLPCGSDFVPYHLPKTT